MRFSVKIPMILTGFWTFSLIIRSYIQNIFLCTNFVLHFFVNKPTNRYKLRQHVQAEESGDQRRRQSENDHAHQGRLQARVDVAENLAQQPVRRHGVHAPGRGEEGAEEHGGHAAQRPHGHHVLCPHGAVF